MNKFKGKFNMLDIKSCWSLMMNQIEKDKDLLRKYDGYIDTMLGELNGLEENLETRDLEVFMESLYLIVD